MTFRLAFGASYSTIVFTVKSLLIYFFSQNPQYTTTCREDDFTFLRNRRSVGCC